MKKYYLIDHKLLFFFGFVFYFLLPYLIGVTGTFKNIEGTELFFGYFRLIPKPKLRFYLYSCISLFISFYLGHFFFTLLRFKRKPLQKFPSSYTTRSIPYVGVLLFIVLLLFAFLSRDILFQGYTSINPAEVVKKAKLSTLLMLYLFFVIYNLVSKERSSIILLTGFGLAILLLASTGGRLYVLMAFIAILIFKTSFADKRWKAGDIFGFLTFALIFGAFVGTWRANTQFDVNSIAYSFVLEPVFTWLSASTFLIKNNPPLFNFPANYLTSFLGLFPNTLFNISKYVVSSKNMGYSYLTPIGAESVWTNYIINFGFIGAPIFLFITGFMYAFVRYLSQRNRFWAVYYIIICSILPFQFFRDGFKIVNKQLFFNCMILPGLLLVLLKLNEFAQKKMGLAANDEKYDQQAIVN